MTIAGGAISARMRDGMNAILLADGRARALIALAAGAFGALAQQPLDLLPALVVSFCLLVWLLDGIGGTGAGLRGLVQAGLAGWSFGFGYFVAGLWWLGSAFIVGGEQFIWLLPLGVVGLPAALALFPALGLVLARLFWSAGGLRIFALAAGLGVSEWLRSWLFTGFPWNGFGQAFANHLVLAQIVSVIGSDGLGVAAIAIFASPALIATGRGAGARFLLPGLGATLLCGTAVFGLVRLGLSGGIAPDFSTMALVDNVRLRIMQPNIEQRTKDQPRDGDAIVRQFLALSDTAKGNHASGIADVTHLIWPEAPFPFVLERNADALGAISDFLPAGTQLITGSIRVEPRADPPPRYRYFNSLQVIDRSGISASYDKVHLVPFGEYLPFEPLLRAIGLEEFVHIVGGFTPSPVRGSLGVPGLPPVLPLICFEAIFPQEISSDREGGAVFINVTNDAWFGQTFGPYQHLAQARLRAIEFGQPLIRAANSGISAVFDPYGRVLAALPLGSADVLDSPLPKGLQSTPYRGWGRFSFAGVIVLFLFFALAGRRIME